MLVCLATKPCKLCLSQTFRTLIKLSSHTFPYSLRQGHPSFLRFSPRLPNSEPAVLNTATVSRANGVVTTNWSQAQWIRSPLAFWQPPGLQVHFVASMLPHPVSDQRLHHSSSNHLLTRASLSLRLSPSTAWLVLYGALLLDFEPNLHVYLTMPYSEGDLGLNKDWSH